MSRRWMALLAIAGAAGGCYAATRSFDSSWGPGLTPQQFAAMAPTLAPDPDNMLDLPRFSVQQAVMPSGLRVGVEPGPARGLVAVVAVLGSGASADPPAREGLAHLVEHLVFHAHGRRERPESERLMRAGAAYNADTSLDTTRFYEAAPAGALPALLDITAERLLHPLAGVDEADLERERAIVENELNQRNETGVYGSVVAWSLWSDAGPPTAVDWVDWRQGTVFSLQHAAVNSAVLESEPFLLRAMSRARSFQLTGAVDSFDRLLWTIAATRVSDVSNVAFRALAPERAHTLFLEPVVGEVQRPGPVGVASPANLSLDASPFRAADFGAPPPAPSPPGLREAHTFSLPNGLTVVLVPRPGFPAVTALLGFLGGAAAVPPGVLTLVRAAETSASTQRGTALLHTERADGPGYTADVVRTDRRHLSNALYLLANRLRDVARTDWAGVLERARPSLAAAPEPIDEPRTQAAVKLRAALYGQHPYGTRVGLDDVRALDPGLAPGWLPYLYAPRNAVLIVSGDMDVAGATRIVSGWFSEWQGPAKAHRLSVPWVPPPARGMKHEEVLMTSRPVGAQVEITFACRQPYPKTAHERAAQRIAASMLGGYLTDKIREQGGATYSIDSASFLAPGGAAHIETSMSVDSRRLRDVLRVLHQQVDILTRGDVDKAALSQVQWGLTRGAALRFQTSSELAEEILQTMTLALPIDAVTGDVDEVARITPADVHRVFVACSEGTVLSLIGDAATIRGAL